jgi:hypothetical protein
MTQGMTTRIAENAGKTAETQGAEGENYAIRPMKPMPTMPMRIIAVTLIVGFVRISGDYMLSSRSSAREGQGPAEVGQEGLTVPPRLPA